MIKTCVQEAEQTHMNIILLLEIYTGYTECIY